MWLIARALPCGAASRVGAALLRSVGPHLRKQHHVLRNLRRALPDESAAGRERIARGMWANLGAVLFEYPHLEHIVAHRVRVTMHETARRLFDDGSPVVVMSAHLANWEVLGSFLAHSKPGVVGVYSPNDNPLLERMIQRFRLRAGGEYVSKQDALRRLSPRYVAGRTVGLLPDVRVDSAPELPLFGVGAPTTISPARLAARLHYPVVPARVKRLGPARFEIEFEAPLTAAEPGPGKRPAMDVMCQFNRRLEAWITERPDEWLCTKRRWPKTPPPSC